MTTWKIASVALATALMVGQTGCFALAQAAGAAPKVPKPDVHAGGPSPSSIPNDTTTEVTLPGLHLTGAQIVAGPICQVVSSRVVSDREIKMTLKGTRKVEDADEHCNLEVRTPGGKASAWLIVELTDAQIEKQRAHEALDQQAKGQDFLRRAGKAWRVSFAGGSEETYTAMDGSGGADGMAMFQKKSGAVVKIAVSKDNSVLMIEPGCMRTGKLAGAEVKDGLSQGECAPSGAWTATIDR